MTDQIGQLDPQSRAHVDELAKELASYGLGIASPHMHDANGNRVSLPSGMVALEQGCHVSFVTEDKVPLDAEPVGWRWVDGNLVAFAGCCGNHE